jgi:hypothetical protein
VIDTIRIFIEKRHYRVISNTFSTRIENMRRVGISQQIQLTDSHRRKPHIYIEKDGRLFLQCSLPKLICGHNLYELEDIALDEVVESIRNLFMEAGVEVDTDIGNWILSRVDFCVNLLVHGEASPYVKALDHFSSTRFNKKVYGGESSYETISFNSRDKKECFIIYDKLTEMRSRGTSVEREMANRFFGKGNFIRLELQLKGQKKIEKRLGENMTLGDIFDKELAYGKIYEFLSNLVHSDDVDYQTIAAMDDANLEYLQYTRMHRQKDAYKEYLLLKYASVELRNYSDDVNTYRRELLERVFPRPSRMPLKITKDIRRALPMSVRIIERTDFIRVLLKRMELQILVARRGRRHLSGQNVAG